MDIIVCRNKVDNRVLSVDCKDNNKTIEEIDEAIRKYKDNDEYDHYFVRYSVDGDLLDVFKFLMGKDTYRRTYTIHNLYYKIKNLLDSLSDLESDISYSCSVVDDIVCKAKEIIKDDEND